MARSEWRCHARCRVFPWPHLQRDVTSHSQITGTLAQKPDKRAQWKSTSWDLLQQSPHAYTPVVLLGERYTEALTQFRTPEISLSLTHSL